MEKFCVFCGRPPQDKNKEHVIPQWLIKMTGNPNRTAAFGVDMMKKPFAPRLFSFDSLTFPACSNCNEAFSNLETATEPVVRKLLSEQAVNENEFITLLDWLDKVRVGLWLGYLYLDKNPLTIKPSFHIETRLGRLDRSVTFVKIENAKTALSFIGPESRFYQLTPTFLALRINGLCLVNASGVSLCSQRLGFPFAQPIGVRADHKLDVSLNLGSGRVMYPVERVPRLPNVVSIYQPVFRTFLESDDGEEFLQDEWVRTHTANFDKGYGKLFLQNDSVGLYPEGESSAWIPSQSWKIWELLDRVPEYIFRRLRHNFEAGIATISSAEERKRMRKLAVMAKMVDRAMLRRNHEQTAQIRDEAF